MSSPDPSPSEEKPEGAEHQPSSPHNSTPAGAPSPPNPPPRPSRPPMRIELWSNLRGLMGSLPVTGNPQNDTEIAVVMAPTGTFGQQGKGHIGFLAINTDWSYNAFKAAILQEARKKILPGEGYKGVEKLRMVSGPQEGLEGRGVGVEEGNFGVVLRVLEVEWKTWWLVAELEV